MPSSPLTGPGPSALARSATICTARRFSRNVQGGGYMRRIVPALLVAAACAPAPVDAQLTTPADWKWRQDTQAPLATGVQDGAGLMGVRADAARLARHDWSRRAPLPVEPTATSTATTRSKSEIFLFPVRAPRSTACFSAASDIETHRPAPDIRVRAAARWPGRHAATGRRQIRRPVPPGNATRRSSPASRRTNRSRTCFKRRRRSRRTPRCG